MRRFLVTVMLAAFPLFAPLTAVPAAAGLAQTAWIDGRVVQISVVSLGVVDATTGKVVHFHLEPYFDEAFSAGGTTKIPMKRIHFGSIVKVFYDRKFTGTRHAERIEIR